MDAFEAVIASILERRGYWTQTSVKVELTKEEKVAIGRPSSPRWELDVVGYSGKRNEILVVECKSYLDSVGVQCTTFDGRNVENQRYYKLFFDETLKKVVFGRLKKQLVNAGLCAHRPKVQLVLAAGKVKGDEEWLRRRLKRDRCGFIGPTEIREELRSMHSMGYENSIAAVVAKILLRE